MKKLFQITLLVLITSAVIFRFACGIFVIQPIGALPEGITIVYLRTDINLPFISSADGLLEESGAGVSLLGRGLMIAKFAKPIKERELFRFGYSETFYLWSTNGKEYKTG